MTLAIPQSEAELLLEDRKGGNLHISRLLAGINTKCLFSKLALLATQPTSKMSHFKYFTQSFLISVTPVTSVVLLSETAGKSISVPEELVAYGHSRTPSQQSKISGRSAISITQAQIKKTQIQQHARLFFARLCCRLQLPPLQYDWSGPQSQSLGRLRLHGHRQHPGTQRPARGERRKGEQDHPHRLSNPPSFNSC